MDEFSFGISSLGGGNSVHMKVEILFNFNLRQIKECKSHKFVFYTHS